MEKIKTIEGKSLLFLVAAICMLCTGFAIISCGSDSKSKIADPYKGAYAVDFTDCEEGGCLFSIDSTSFEEPEYKFAGNPVTMEVWVKPTSSATTSRIFQRIDPANGVMLSLASGKPVFTIRRANNPTGTVQYSVSAQNSIAEAWTHIAGLLVNEAHSSVHSACSDGSGAESDPWHLDIYVDGVFSDCAKSFDGKVICNDPNETRCPSLDGTDDTTPAEDAYATDPGDNTLGSGFAGTIDETRLWKADRTNLIDTCKDRELGLNGGDCSRETPDLIGYQRFNEGEGHTVTDFAGLGTGAKEYPTGETLPNGDNEYAEWDEGWTGGAQVNGGPITPAD